MLSYSSCSDFYKCPFLFQYRDEFTYTSSAMTLGKGIDTMMNALLVSEIDDADLKEKKCIELGISDMLMAMVNNKDLCEILNVPEMVKQWYYDFKKSGLKVVDVQAHFIIDDLDYHGYADAVLTDGETKYVVENKTTSRFYDSFMSNKKESYQAIGYAIGFGTRNIRYQFFNTKNMKQYAPYSKFVTDREINDFRDWVSFVHKNKDSFVKNREYCSLNNCPFKERC